MLYSHIRYKSIFIYYELHHNSSLETHFADILWILKML